MCIQSKSCFALNAGSPRFFICCNSSMFMDFTSKFHLFLFHHIFLSLANITLMNPDNCKPSLRCLTIRGFIRWVKGFQFIWEMLRKPYNIFLIFSCSDGAITVDQHTARLHIRLPRRMFLWILHQFLLFLGFGSILNIRLFPDNSISRNTEHPPAFKYMPKPHLQGKKLWHLSLLS